MNRSPARLVPDLAMLGLAMIAGSAPASGQVLSPRLAGVLASKGLDPLDVEIWTRPGAPAPSGATIVSPDHYLAAFAPGALADLAADPAVAYVAPADPLVAPDSLDAPDGTAQPPGPADKALRPEAAAAGPHGTGRGVTIGVIDFGDVPADPGIAALRSFGRSGAGSHAAAVVAILRRLAPEARLVVAVLSPAAATSADLQRAAAWLEAEGARIITFSGASYTNRRDGLAPIDRIVDAQVARGIVWIAASGNEAQRSWIGPTVDRDRDGLVDIATGLNAITLRARGPVNLALTWDDWGQGGAPRGQWDIGLVVTNAQGQIVAAERSQRLSVGEPVKTLQLGRLAPGAYRIALPLRGRGTPVDVRLTATGMADFLAPAVPFASIGNPATARGAIAVAAVDPRRSKTTVYSGQGPTADQRPKPELGASGAGDAGRAGSSYAAPRIAAMAARVLSSRPGLRPRQVMAALAAYGRPLLRRNVLGEAERWIDTRQKGDQ